jgi:HEAT repeat protein
MNELKAVGIKNKIGTNLELLMERLESKDYVTRRTARKSLVALGKPAVNTLANVLQNSKLDHVRWEAAKTLGYIEDPEAIPSLVKALEDTDIDVKWAAANALAKFKMAAWPQLLNALIKNSSESVLLQQGAHHVFHNQKEDGFNDLLETLIKTLETGTIPESTALAAYAILEKMKTKS